MKQIITLILITIFPENLHAQTSIWSRMNQNNSPDVQKHRTLVSTMLRMQQQQAAFKTTAQAERVVAMSSSEKIGNTWYVRDTTKLYYSGSNGSAYNYDMMGYEYELLPVLNYAMYPFSWSTVHTMADSVAYFTNDNPGDPLYLSNVINSDYSSSGQFISHKSQEWVMGNPGLGRLIDYTYDAQDRRQQMIVYEVAVTAADTVAIINTFYDTQGRRVVDSIFEYSNGSLTPRRHFSFTYDNNNNITKVEVLEQGMSGWEPVERIDMTFYNDNRLKTTTSFTNMGSGLEPYIMDSLGYTGTVPFPTYYQLSMVMGGMTTPLLGLTRQLNAQNLPDTTVVFQTSQSVPGQMEEAGVMEIEFTSMGNPIQATMHQVVAPNTYETVFNYRYYYETYTTGVENTPKKSEVVVYPNPVDGQLNIDLKDQNAQAVNIELVNAAGQRVLTGKVPVNGGKAQLSTQTLVPGMYWMQVRGENGAVLHSQTVVKQ